MNKETPISPRPPEVHSSPIEGQLNPRERELIQEYLMMGDEIPRVALEVGTWLGGGSTLVILRELVRAGTGHLWGVEADQGIYERMIENIRNALPEGLSYFTPLLGLSQKRIPEWIASQGKNLEIDFIFLDGGDSPREQIDEFHLLDPHLKVSGRILSHDANFRKGKWFVPYIKALDNYQVSLHQVSDEGLLTAIKVSPNPTRESKRKAESILRKSRREPIELLGHMVPKWVLQLAARIFPESLIRRYGQGRK